MEKEEPFRMTLSLGKSQLMAVDTIVVVLARRQGECDRSKAIRYILAEGLDAIRGSLKIPLTQDERDVLACKEKA